MTGKSTLFTSDQDFESEKDDAPPDKLIEWLSDRFGGTPQQIQGRWLFDSAVSIVEGISVHWGHDAGVTAVEFTGTALSQMTMPERVAVIRELQEWGAHATRLDVCADFFNQSFRLVHRVLRAEKRGELCRTRTIDPRMPRSLGVFTGKTVYLGKRGKEGSGRFGRFYDKGLQTGTMPVGTWERFEVEFNKATAAYVAAQIAQAVDPIEACRSVLFGAFDFRKNTGRAHLKDRPRCVWWERVIASTGTIHFTPKRPAANVTRYAKHFARCYTRTLRAISHKTGLSLASIVDALSGETHPKKIKHGSVEEQFIRWHKSGGACVLAGDTEDIPI
jgi:DNA relaxase NicK